MLGHASQFAVPSKVGSLTPKLEDLVKCTDKYKTQALEEESKTKAASSKDATEHTSASTKDMTGDKKAHEDVEDVLTLPDTSLTEDLEKMFDEDTKEVSEEECIPTGFVKGCLCPACKAAAVLSLLTEDEEAPQTPLDSSETEAEMSDSSAEARRAPAGETGRGAQKVWDATSNTKKGKARQDKKNLAVDGPVTNSMFGELTPKSRRKAIIRFMVRRRLTKKTAAAFSKASPDTDSASAPRGKKRAAQSAPAPASAPATASAPRGKSRAKAKAKSKAQPKKASKPEAAPKQKAAKLILERKRPKLVLEPRPKSLTTKARPEPEPDPSKVDKAAKIRLPLQRVVRQPLGSRVGEAYLLQAKEEPEEGSKKYEYQSFHIKKCFHAGVMYTQV